MKPLTMALSFFALSFAATAAFAEVKLPKSAKLMTKAEIIAAYGGKKVIWSHPNTDKAKGVANYDAKMTKGSGTFVNGDAKGEWESEVFFKGDQYCYRVRLKGQKDIVNQSCTAIYVDGGKYYEINPKTKVIESLNIVETPAAKAKPAMAAKPKATEKVTEEKMAKAPEKPMKPKVEAPKVEAKAAKPDAMAEPKMAKAVPAMVKPKPVEKVTEEKVAKIEATKPTVVTKPKMAKALPVVKPKVAEKVTEEKVAMAKPAPAPVKPVMAKPKVAKVATAPKPKVEEKVTEEKVAKLTPTKPTATKVKDTKVAAAPTKPAPAKPAAVKIANLPEGAKLLTKSEALAAYGGKLCPKTKGDPVCNMVYTANNTLYEVDPETKKILSVKKIVK